VEKEKKEAGGHGYDFYLGWFGLGLVMTYYLCRIDSSTTYGGWSGVWHGMNFVNNLILSLFDGRRLSAHYHTKAYPFWHGIFAFSAGAQTLWRIGRISGSGKDDRQSASEALECEDMGDTRSAKTVGTQGGTVACPDADAEAVDESVVLETEHKPETASTQGY
jgi:hypothetical protein